MMFERGVVHATSWRVVHPPLLIYALQVLYGTVADTKLHSAEHVPHNSHLGGF